MHGHRHSQTPGVICGANGSQNSRKTSNDRDLDSLSAPRGGEGTPYNGLYGEAPPERGTFFRLEVYKRVGISRAEVQKRAGKTDI